MKEPHFVNDLEKRHGFVHLHSYKKLLTFLCFCFKSKKYSHIGKNNLDSSGAPSNF